MKIRNRLTLGLTVVILICIGVVSTVLQANAQQTARVHTPGSVLNCRKAPNGTIIRTLPHGTTVKLTGQQSGSWREVNYQTSKCWVSSAYLIISPTSTGSSSSTQSNTTNARVNTPGSVLNCRKAPDSSIVRTLPHGASVQLTGQKSGVWYKVTYQGTTCWSSGDYLIIQQNNDTTDFSTTTKYNACSSTVTYTMRVVIATQYMSSDTLVNARKMAKDLDSHLKEFSEGCADIITEISESAIQVTSFASTGVDCNKYAAKFGWPKNNSNQLFTVITDPSVSSSGAVGSSYMGCMWAEAGKGHEWVTRHELLHYFENRMSSAGLQKQLPNGCGISAVHCSTHYGYKADSSQWFDDFYSGKVAGSLGIRPQDWNLIR
jgi:uncharacterized protein YgiM (DUF1202 family)